MKQNESLLLPTTMALFDRLRQRINQLVDDHLAVPDAIREDLDQGKAALDAGDPVEAERHLALATSKAADHATAWFLLGLSQLRQDKGTEACASLQRAAELRAEDFKILAALGEAMRAAGRPSEAISAFKRALRCPADESLLDQVYGGLGEIYLQQGESERAVRELRKAVAIEQGRDLRIVGLLGLAQRRVGELALAQESLSRAAAAVPLDRAVMLSLSEVLFERGDADGARLAALRLVEEDERDAAARCVLAKCLLAQGQPGQARDELLRALEHDPRCATAHLLLAQVAKASQAYEAALTNLRTAQTLIDSAGAEGTEGTEVLRQILELELELEAPPPELVEDANRLLELEAEDPLALAALAVATLDGDPGQATAAAQRSLAQVETYHGMLALGLCHLDQGRPAQAAATLRTAVRLDPQRRRGQRALVEAFKALAAADTQPTTFYSLVDRVHQLFVAQPELSDISVEVAKIKEVFDRPLLVTVMGEFNCGKSTFVNALIGEEVAPMGVTPTTATINVLKYGARRAARVLWRDDRDQELAWEEVGPFLRRLGKEQARMIRLVELMYPAEELLRVNVVDTPGLNSMIDEHEQTAREYMGQADAVIWLFSAHQAGKQTEQQALELLRRHRLKTVGVLNKIDRLSAQELDQVQRHLETEFSDLVEAVIPVSARAALRALVGEQAEALEQSRFPELRRVLERQIFARGRRIKREAGQMRLGEVLERGRRRAERLLEQTDGVIDQLDGVPSWVQDQFPASSLEAERQQVEIAFRGVFRQGAEEVLDFVRPRRWVLGEHRASPADRDYLLGLLLDGLGQMGRRSLERMSDHLTTVGRGLRQRLMAALEGTPLASQLEAQLEPWLRTIEPLTQERCNLLQQQVYTRFNAFARGFLRGGMVDRFFSELPHKKLVKDTIYLALTQETVDLEGELLEPLARWYEQAAPLLVDQVRRMRQEVDLLRVELDHRLLGPLILYQRATKTIAEEAARARAVESDPAESDQADVESDPAESDQAESDQAEGDPAESDPAESDPAETGRDEVGQGRVES